MHKFIQTYIHTQIDISIHTSKYMCIHTHAHAHAQPRYTYPDIHNHSHAYMCISMCVSKQTRFTFFKLPFIML